MSLRARVRTQLGTLRLDCDLSVDANLTVAVLGPNGAGKTTLLRVIAGLVPVDEGRVEIDGAVQPAPAPRFARCGTVTPRPPRLNDQDEEQVLLELGYDPARIRQLRQVGALRARS